MTGLAQSLGRITQEVYLEIEIEHVICHLLGTQYQYQYMKQFPINHGDHGTPNVKANGRRGTSQVDELIVPVLSGYCSWQ